MAASTLTLPLMAALTLVGAGIGVQLGKSAIAEINPVYYDEADTRFHADLVPYRPREGAGDLRPAALVYRDGELGSGCIGCRTYPEEYIPQHDGAVDGYAASAWAPAEEPPVQQAVYQAGAEEAGRFAQVERYATYPVEAGEERPQPVRAETVEAETDVIGM